MAGFTVAHLEAIEKALASGKLKVRYDGKETQYQTTSELLDLRRVTFLGGNCSSRSRVIWS